MKKCVLPYLVVITVITLMNSCKKEEILNTYNSTQLNQSGIEVSVKHGMLVFSSMEAYQRTIEQLDKMSDVEAALWEKSIGIKTQRGIFSDIVKAENDLLITPYEGLSQDELQNVLAPKSKHSELYFAYLNKGLIKIVDPGTQDEYFDYATINPAFAKVINKDGFIAIGSTLYQFTNTEIKSKENYSIDDVQLLGVSKISNESERILVITPNSVANNKVMGDFDFDMESSWGYSSSNDRRIKIRVIFNSNLTGGGTGCTANHNVNVVVQKKNIWGNWVASAQQMWLNGNWDSQFTLFNYQELNYYPTYSYYNATVNNYWSSISPTSANVAPYASSFIYKAPAGNPFWYELDILNGTWTASTSGGCCGAQATLNVY